MAKLIKLSQGKEAIVDDEDFDVLSCFNWSLISSRGMSYAKAWENGKHIQMHRKILGVIDPKIQVDHKNHNTLDNRKSNLRIATNAQNCANRASKKNSTSNFRGVYFRKDTKKWVAMAYKGGQKVHVGSFENEIDAAIAYNNTAARLHGEFAYINIIPPR